MLRFDQVRLDPARRKDSTRFRNGAFSRLASTRTASMALALAAIAAVTSCDFLDPTSVENPRTTAEDLAQARQPTQALLPGLRAQFARAISGSSVLFEVASDNYSINGTGLNPQLDEPADITPQIANSTASSSGVYWNLQELRALTDFVLNDIAPEDTTATAEQRAEAHYYRGMAYLIQGENFQYVPVEVDGTPLPASELLQRAITEFGASTGLVGSGDFALRSVAATARAHRLLGDEVQAAQSAQDALGMDVDFAFLQGFDEQSIVNGAHLFTTDRSIKEMQPLPRLDFLDPKYLSRAAGIPVAKAEEMHLILAEIELAGGAPLVAAGHLVDALELALTRPTQSFLDDDERRNGDLSFRPRTSDMQVRADADSPFRAGLVLNRPNVTLSIPVISGTSLDPDSIALLTDEDEIWHAFHLARQEIMFLEGRRMSDLGIRLPMMLREIEANPNIAMGDPGTAPLVPAYIPEGREMDLFSPATPYDSEGEQTLTTEITILFDMNRILATERVTPFN